ncbi:CAP-Gly domain-containing linker protein 3-like isoform X4 [Chiloscyllium plagiosum]|uniref:CAP-Gly domain-containing linker protein 3-like isoform X4 n=1 Tax=Chiloscyllium plagiosum TaxID=36176 RepID=UPI001CB84D63|nr:CAP-Gly domain-containing linker protein 3-like isoform X4 [Chiloscyllium plagiosum]
MPSPYAAPGQLNCSHFKYCSSPNRVRARPLEAAPAHWCRPTSVPWRSQSASWGPVICPWHHCSDHVTRYRICHSPQHRALNSDHRHWVNRHSSQGASIEMTKEDPFVEPSNDEDSVSGSCSTVSSDSERPVVHPVVSAPMPTDCEFSFFDPQDPACKRILHDLNTTVSELFAILRQWVPQVQQQIDVIGNEILSRGCHVNDRDGLTDMTLLHYTCKAGAQGIGDAEVAAKFASQLIEMGADVTLRSRWTNMNALHYAAYFDVPELIRVVLKDANVGDVDATCSDFNFGTSLHIAASNLCLSAVKCLLEHGANPVFRLTLDGIFLALLSQLGKYGKIRKMRCLMSRTKVQSTTRVFTNDKGQMPVDIVPDPLDMPLEMAEAAAVAKELKQMLLDALPLTCNMSKAMLTNYDHISGKALLMSLGLKLGERVMIAGQKVGTLRFCGTTEFASGQWAGIELDEPEGKNDGSICGIQYFSCPIKHGIFAPLSKISKVPVVKKSVTRTSSSKTSTPVRSQKIDLSHVTSKVNTGLRSRAPSVGSLGSVEICKTHIQIGDRVVVVGQRSGTVRFYGKTSFAPGYWYGIELDKPNGKNDGSVGGVQYFTCVPKHGVFAPPSRVQRVTEALDSFSDVPTSKLNRSVIGFHRSFSTPSALPSPREIKGKNASNRPKNAIMRRSWSSTSTTEGSVKLQEGSQVLLSSSSEMATIKYIGPTDFAPGIWLGLELRSPKGKNDGSVGEKRYFSCKPNYGVLVRPSRVTYRGINGTKLVDDICG